jgi:hypothetical protein
MLLWAFVDVCLSEGAGDILPLFEMLFYTVCNVYIKKHPMGPVVCQMMILKVKKNRR